MHKGPPRIDLTGKVFGRLTVVRRIEIEIKPYPTYDAQWECVCSCGNKIVTSRGNLKRGDTKSCGCLRREVSYKKCKSMTKHGHARNGNISPTFRSWSGMLNRCFRRNDPFFYRYGGRGIIVCDRWRNSFENFLSDMGERPPGKTIDRINNDGNYEPSNCRWATPIEQANNKSK